MIIFEISDWGKLDTGYCIQSLALYNSGVDLVKSKGENSTKAVEWFEKLG
jgi:hypothetical protein